MLEPEQEDSTNVGNKRPERIEDDDNVKQVKGEEVRDLYWGWLDNIDKDDENPCFIDDFRRNPELFGDSKWEETGSEEEEDVKVEE